LQISHDQFLILEIALVSVVESFPTHPVNACCFRTVVVKDVLERLFDPLTFANEVIQVFKSMTAIGVCLTG